MSRSSLARSLFNVCGMMFMAVSPSDARPLRCADRSKSRVDTEVKVEAAGPFVGAFRLAVSGGTVVRNLRRMIFEAHEDAEAILACEATERMAGKRGLLLRAKRPDE